MLREKQGNPLHAVVRGCKRRPRITLK